MKISERLYARDAANEATVQIQVTLCFPNGRLTKSEILGIRGEIQEQLAHFVKTIPFTDFGVASLHFHK